MNKTVTGVVLDGSGSRTQSRPQIRLPQGDRLVLDVEIVDANGDEFDLTGYEGRITIRRRDTDGTLVVARSWNTVSGGTAQFILTRADTYDEDPGSCDWDCVITEIATGYDYTVIPKSLFELEDAVSNADDPANDANDPQRVVGMPYPEPSYDAVPYWDTSEGAFVWRQTARVTVTFDGNSAVETATWTDFEARDFAIYVSPPITDDVEAVTIQIIAASITSTGCTVQASAPFVGTVELEILEKV